MDHDDRGYRVLSITEEEPVPLKGGATQWLPLRRRLGIQAFGTNLYRAPLKGGAVIEEHVESTGQQEMYVVISGRVRFALGEDELEAPEGTVVFVLEPDLRRSATALEDDSAVLAVGGWTDQPYHSLPWEPIYLAQDSMRQGDWAAAAATLESEAGEHRDNAFVQFRLACCHAQLGEHETALEELRRAIELSPGMRERATSEEHLAPLRGLEGWPTAIG
ncbi:MAG: tetratricopeptide repeat protein [Actinomycetota bacterium]